MAFERDLGYLDKFFDNLDAHAATLEDGPGARLQELVGEERVRWSEIRSLLAAPSAGGAAEQADKADKPKQQQAPSEPKAEATKAEPTPAKPTLEPAAAQPSGAPAAPAREPGAGFTVGSLRSR